MKIILFITTLTFLTFGCKKDEPPVPDQPGGPIGTTIDTVTRPPLPEIPGDINVPPHARRAVAGATKDQLRTHASAAKYYLTIPDSAMPMPIPPAMRPFKNLKLQKVYPNSVLYTFETAAGRPGDMALVQHITGNDTIWIPLHILPK